jgi:RNA recognition motif-containing protein
VEDAEPSTAAAAEGRRRAGVNDELEPEPDAVSHAEQRKRRKLEKKQKVAKVVEGDDDDGEHLGEPAAAASTSTPSSATAATSKDSNTEKRSGHGVWVGNLSFKTDSERVCPWSSDVCSLADYRIRVVQLRKFFAPCGAITRLYMPKGGQKFAQNKGFAYIDFEDPVGVTTAISMSEQNLDGRRLLIKDSKSYEGRPKSAATEAVTAAVAGPAGASTGDKSMSKTARKILDRQKNPPAPTLFAGNLGFETTVSEIFAKLPDISDPLFNRSI